MPRYRSFLFPEASVGAESLTLDARESHHLVRVLRAKVGETVAVLDGAGACYLGRIAEANGKAVRVDVDSVERAPLQKPQVTLLQSIPKGKTMDIILRMATEIGAARVQPVFTDQGEMLIKGERLLSKVAKWRLTMIESCKQCGVSYLPELAAPLALSDWLAAHLSAGGRVSPPAAAFPGGRVSPPAAAFPGGRVSPPAAAFPGGRVSPPAAAFPGGRVSPPAAAFPRGRVSPPAADAASATGCAGILRVVASLEAGSRPLREVLEAAGAVDEVVVAVGPEGDFTPAEYVALSEAGFLPVRLGANVLRAETAAAYILSVVDQCSRKA